MRVRPYLPPAGADKELRVDAQSIAFENGRVFLRRPARWLNDYIAELTGFPNTKYDDQVDSTVQFLVYMRQPGTMPMVVSEEALRLISMPGPWTRRGLY